ncbi:unnamed protein product [Phytophthora lilii]|uniref:Unnamed protein product n=1 Tax=Phytophthora lilii TaxID=2077276 RepID=A0A9W6UED9_9STRA|nr:unnamed protein product [Phytophthora lilii]
MMHFVGSFCSSWVLGEVSELTFSIMSTMKRVVVILSAVLYFGNPVTFQSILGMALAVRRILCCGQAKRFALIFILIGATTDWWCSSIPASQNQGKAVKNAAIAAYGQNVRPGQQHRCPTATGWAARRSTAWWTHQQPQPRSAACSACAGTAAASAAATVGWATARRLPPRRSVGSAEAAGAWQPAAAGVAAGTRPGGPPVPRTPSNHNNNKESSVSSGFLLHPSPSRPHLLGGLDVVARDDVDEEVEDVGLGDSHGDVVALQRAALVLLRVDPGAQTELEDEHLAGLGEEHGRLGADHAHVLVRLHDLLDARERQLVRLEVEGAGVDLRDLLDLVLPEGVQRELLLLHLRALVLQLQLHLQVGVVGAAGVSVAAGHGGGLHGAAGGHRHMHVSERRVIGEKASSILIGAPAFRGGGWSIESATSGGRGEPPPNGFPAIALDGASAGTPFEIEFQRAPAVFRHGYIGTWLHPIIGRSS